MYHIVVEYLLRLVHILDQHEGVVAILGVFVAIAVALITFRWPWRGWGLAILAVCMAVLVAMLMLTTLPYHPYGNQNMSLNVPSVFEEVQDGHDAQFVFQDGHGSYLHFWPGTHPVKWAWVTDRYDGLKEDAMKNLPQGGSLDEDRAPTTRSPYYVLSWTDKSGIDHYNCGGLKRIGSQWYVGRFEVLSPAATNALNRANYDDMRASFLASIGQHR
jgi:hypothetical protein